MLIEGRKFDIKKSVSYYNTSPLPEGCYYTLCPKDGEGQPQKIETAVAAAGEKQD